MLRMKAPSLPTDIPLDHPRFSLLVAEGWDDYRLVDMGEGRKLERFGAFLVDRPEEQAMGARLALDALWTGADAVFDGDAEEGEGRWCMAKRSIPETFPMRWNGLAFHGRFTAFRHMGLFPEQAVHWHWLAERIRAAGRPIKLLNLFGYTGLASLVAAEAGAHVTHVDASKRAITQARENQALAGLADKPIRWIVEDAVKFVEREIRRGNRYQAIVLDPPKFGRGPNGEIWRLFEDLPQHLAQCAALLADDADCLILTAYAIRASFLAIDDLARGLLADRRGTIQSGELALRVEGSERLLSTSLYTRWCRP